MQETGHPLLSLFIEASVTRTKPLIHSQALMAAASKHSKQQSCSHSLAVGLHRKMHKITKTRKLNYVIAEFIKPLEATIYK